MQSVVNKKRLTSYLTSAILVLGFVSIADAQVWKSPSQAKQEQEEEKQPKNWSITPGLDISGTYSDNINLDIPGEEKGDFLTEVNPTLNAKLKGNRLKGEIDYRMQNLFYAKETDANTTYNQYNAWGKAELWRERLFLDINSTLEQRIISSGRYVRGNRNPSVNRTDQLTASARPYWRQPLGASAEALLQYEYGIVDFDEDKVEGITSDSQLNDIQFSVGTPTSDKDRLFSWSVKYVNQNINYDSDEFDDIKFKRASVEVGYPVTTRLGLIAIGGYEDNELGASYPSTDTKGALWEAGFRWQPSSKTRLEASFGDRFFGNTGFFSWQQRGRRINTEVRYKKDIGGYTGYVLQGARLIESPGRFPTGALGLTSSVYIRERLDAIATLKTLKNLVRIVLFNEDRDFQTAGNTNERWSGINAIWEWQIAPRTAMKPSISWGNLKPSNSDRDDYPFFIDITLERQLARNTAANLTYSYSRLDSDEPLIEYRENAVTLGLTHSF